MRNRTMTIMGVSIIVIGSIILVNNFTGINLWVYLFPLLLIALGIWIITQPKQFPVHSFSFIGEMDRRGSWAVKPEYITCLIADIDLDMRDAVIPVGNTPISIRGFVGDITLRIPENVGIKINAQAFVVDANVFGYKQDYFLTPYSYQSENFTSAERTLNVELSHFVASIKVQRR